jgi:hypothetical protein
MAHLYPILAFGTFVSCKFEFLQIEIIPNEKYAFVLWLVQDLILNTLVF